MQPDPWPATPEDLEAAQRALAELADRAPPWQPVSLDDLAIGGVFVTSPTGAPDRDVAAGDPAWAGAVVVRGRKNVAAATARGRLRAPYVPGYLALQYGPLLEEIARTLGTRPDVLLIDATGRDHPRRAGLALHLGAVLGLPTVGVTDQPLVASGSDPERRRWSVAPLFLGEEVVGYRLRSKRGVHPIVVHAGWRTGPETALAVVRAACGSMRTPEPLRRARRLARMERARDEGRLR